MLVPLDYPDHESYFRAAVDLLADYRWVYNIPNTELLVQDVLSRVPQGWAEVLLALTNDELNQFPSGLVKDDWPPSLKEFSRRCLSLRVPIAEISLDETGDIELDHQLKRGLSLKKRHEVCRMAKFVHQECRKQGITRMLDVGSGLGYIGQLLHHNYGYQILGLESCNKKVSKSYSRQYDLCPLGSTVKTISFQVGSDSTDDVQEALDFFSRPPDLDCGCGEKRKKDENNRQQASNSNAQGSGTGVVLKLRDVSADVSDAVCMIALHACGDLTVDASKIFLRLPSVQIMILIPCCYHKMSLLRNQNEEVILESGGIETFRNFPLSGTLRQVLEETSPDFGSFLRRPCLRLASQMTPLGWAQVTEESREIHSIHLMGRAVLGLLAHKEGKRVQKKKRRGVHNGQFVSIETYIECALSGYEFGAKDGEHENCHSNLSSCNIRSQVATLWSLHASAQRLAEVFTGLQTMMQPIVEQLVLCDRAQYLKENTYGDLFCDVIKVLDESLSPRCMALISKKLYE